MVRNTAFDLHLKRRMRVAFRRRVKLVTGVGKTDQLAAGGGGVLDKVKFVKVLVCQL
jgi:hypothetical protein